MNSLESQIQEDKRKEHQRKLEEKKQMEAQERFAKKNQKASKDEKDGDIKVVESYSSVAEFPREAMKHKVNISIYGWGI